MIDIMSISGELLLSVPVLSDAVVREELMADDCVRLSWRADYGDALPTGTYVMYGKEKYSLLQPYYPTRVNEVEFEYKPQFESRIVRWKKLPVPVYTFLADGTTVKSREFDWTFTGTPSDAMSLVRRAIKHETGEDWSVVVNDGLADTVEVASESSSIWSLLSDIAEQCETEWWVEKDMNVLHLGKCIHGSNLSLEVGKNVQVPSVTVNKEDYYTRFYAFGSTRNITQDNAVSTGCIVNKRLSLDPIKYPKGYKDIKGHFENGVFVSDLEEEEIFPTSLYFEEVYPSSKLSINNVRKRLRYRLDDSGNKIIVGGTESNPEYEQYAIWYFQIPNFSFTEDLIIEGLELSVHFKTGKLGGREFALAYHSKAEKVADSNDVDSTFAVREGDYEILFDEQSTGLIIPSVDYIIPQNGDEVILFNIEMPDEYIDSAYVDLEARLDEEIERRNKDNNSYEFNSNPIAFYEAGTDVKLGQAVSFLNNGAVLETRVLMVEKHLDYSFDQRIRVGNSVIVGTRQQLWGEVEEAKRETSEKVNSQRRYTQRRFRSAQETLDMLSGAFSSFSEGISPITVRTMSMLVGDESLQFNYVTNTTNPAITSPTIEYDSKIKRLVSSGDIIQHMTLGIDEVSSSHDISEYNFWRIEARNYEVPENDKACYVYIKAPQDGSLATLVCRNEAMEMGPLDGYYYFLTAILNSELDGKRDLVFVNGFTEILPAQITTNIIRSSDGQTYFDLANNEIGGVIKFKAGSEGIENLKGLPEYVNNEISKVKVGGQNMLRNSGFTGDYLSEKLADDVVLNATSQMLNGAFTHWTKQGQVASVTNLEGISVTGSGVSFGNAGVLSQSLYQGIIAGEKYIVSFKAKCATSSAGTVVVGDGINPSVTTELTQDWANYQIKLEPSSASSEFKIGGQYAIVCDLQLERGTVATSWSNSPFDNNSDRAYYNALKYLSDAIKGETLVSGGLVLTSLLKLGALNGNTFEEFAGVNGLYGDDNTPAFWAGGSLAQAIEAVEKYAADPTYKPTDTELLAMAKAVITHGGRAILNDAILRGTVYADAGRFGDFQIDGLYAKSSHDTSHGCRWGDGTYIAWNGDRRSEINAAGVVEVENESLQTTFFGMYSNLPFVADPALSREKFAFHALSGQIGGMRPALRTITQSGSSSKPNPIYDSDHTLIITPSDAYLKLPTHAKDGHELTLVTPYGAGIRIIGGDIFDMAVGTTDVSWISEQREKRGTIHLVYCDEIGLWFLSVNYQN